MASEYILIVDDDDGIRSLVRDVLTDLDYVTRGAEHGRAALEIAIEDRPALVLLDMRMPVMDGWEFARRLRESVGEVPIIVMTAARDAAAWAAEVSAQAFLPKPFDLDRLVEVVEQNLAPA